jgi:hypothetical protein
MADVHEFILFGFKPGFDRSTQFETMREIAPVMTALEGMKVREWYYSERDDLWVTHLIWVDEEAIERAGPELERDKRAMSLFDRLDLDTLVYAKFEAVGSAVGRATL